MKQDLCHFEGNAQALRILSKIANRDVSHEINLTKGVISALIKYPTNSLNFKGKEDDDIRKHKLGYFYAENIAYTTADLEDAYKKEMFTMEEFITFFENKREGIKQ